MRKITYQVDLSLILLSILLLVFITLNSIIIKNKYDEDKKANASNSHQYNKFQQIGCSKGIFSLDIDSVTNVANSSKSNFMIIVVDSSDTRFSILEEFILQTDNFNSFFKDYYLGIVDMNDFFKKPKGYSYIENSIMGQYDIKGYPTFIIKNTNSIGSVFFDYNHMDSDFETFKKKVGF